MDITKIQSAGYKITYIAQPGETGPRVLYWGSPFSREATAAIRASFTAAQWETIKAWGATADAYLIAAVNQFAVEDPRILCSLCSDLGITRKLISDGNSTIDTGHTPTKDVKIHIVFKLPNENASVYGSAISYSSRTFELYGYGGGEINYGNAYQIVGGLVGNRVELWSDGRIFQYKVNDGSLVSKTFGTFSGTFPYDLALFANRRSATMPTTGTAGVEIELFEMEDTDDFAQNLIPFVGATRTGMIDILTNTLHPNQGTGAFTAEEV